MYHFLRSLRHWCTSAFHDRLLTVLSRASGVRGADSLRAARGTFVLKARYSAVSLPFATSTLRRSTLVFQASSDASGIKLLRVFEGGFVSCWGVS